MKEIILHNGMVAMVDDEDYERLNAHPWRANRPRKLWYAMRTGPSPERRTIYMHRVIMNAPAEKQVDHRNGNGLDNTRSNLRLASRCQNQWNRNKPEYNTSGYKGTCGRNGRWIAQIKHQNNHYYLGRYDDPIDAAKAYDRKARELHGEFAKTNFSE